jgi:hypothetical protein
VGARADRESKGLRSMPIAVGAGRRWGLTATGSGKSSPAALPVACGRHTEGKALPAGSLRRRGGRRDRNNGVDAMNRLALLALGPFLASCAALDFRPGPPGDSGGSIVHRNAAERACVAQAGEQMLELVRVVGSQPVSGSGGVLIGRDVTLLVVDSAGERQEVSCSFVTSTGEARIMSP